MLDPARAGRGDTITVTIASGPAASTKTRMSLQRHGQLFDLEDAAYTASADGRGTATGTIPQHLPLGDYIVRVALDRREYRAGDKLKVQPPGVADVHLNEFSPANTYDLGTAYVPATWKAERIDVVRLKLKEPVAPNDRIDLRVPGVSSRGIVWNGCANLPPLGSEAHPAATRQVFGRKGRVQKAREALGI